MIIKWKYAALAALAIVTGITPVAAKSQEAARPAQLEVCGLRSVNAPWCDEALAGNTAQLQSAQIVSVSITGRNQERWLRANRDKRGVGWTQDNAEGEPETAGRSVIKAVYRVYLYPPSGQGEPLLGQAVAAADGSALTLLLPANGNYVGWTAFVLSPRGDKALDMSGVVHDLSRRERRDGRLLTSIPRELQGSRITSTTLVRRGDGSNAIEALEATFTDRVRFADGRRFSGLPGTFRPISEGGTTVLAFTREDTVGDRLVTCGNLRIDPATAVITGGVSLIPQGIQLLFTSLKSRC